MKVLFKFSNTNLFPSQNIDIQIYDHTYTILLLSAVLYICTQSEINISSFAYILVQIVDTIKIVSILIQLYR